MIKRGGRRKKLLQELHVHYQCQGRQAAIAIRTSREWQEKTVQRYIPGETNGMAIIAIRILLDKLRKTRRRQNLCMYKWRQIPSTYNCESFRRYTQTTAFLHNNRKQQQQQQTMLLKHLSIDLMLPNWQDDRWWKPTRRGRIRIEFSNDV